MKAFPWHEGFEKEAGMDLRDYFAAKAMQAILIKTYEGGNYQALLASTSYKFADEMMKARKE